MLNGFPAVREGRGERGCGHQYSTLPVSLQVDAADPEVVSGTCKPR